LIAAAILTTAAPSLSAVHYQPAEHGALSRLHLHLNGLTYHFSTDRSELNEFNYGLGASWDLGRLAADNRLIDGTIIAVEGEVYSDSFSQLGAAFGLSAQRNLCRGLDFGLRLGLMHEDNLRDKVGVAVFPYLLPYLQTRFGGPLDARLTLVPPLGSKTGGLAALQLILHF